MYSKQVFKQSFTKVLMHPLKTNNKNVSYTKVFYARTCSREHELQMKFWSRTARMFRLVIREQRTFKGFLEPRWAVYLSRAPAWRFINRGSRVFFLYSSLCVSVLLTWWDIFDKQYLCCSVYFNEPSLPSSTKLNPVHSGIRVFFFSCCYRRWFLRRIKSNIVPNFQAKSTTKCSNPSFHIRTLNCTKPHFPKLLGKLILFWEWWILN